MSNIEILSFTFTRFNLRARITMSLDSAYPPGNGACHTTSETAKEQKGWMFAVEQAAL
ncbi:hypothetical protein ACEWF6_09215 [Bifidobacterium catenulatum subsp. kashiwanohense]|uniref:hypothetical protein n=1 Tax=Bifidobacterium catenulatum TaxID=1686 RepID=UPI003CFE3E16